MRKEGQTNREMDRQTGGRMDGPETGGHFFCNYVKKPKKFSVQTNITAVNKLIPSQNFHFRIPPLSNSQMNEHLIFTNMEN
jgi:hypothetical protein